MQPRCFCGAPSVLLTTDTTRKFKCNLGTCSFLQNAPVPSAPTHPQPTIRNPRTPAPKELCTGHREPVALASTPTGPQPGRRYMHCARPRGQQCAYFRLLEAPPLAPPVRNDLRHFAAPPGRTPRRLPSAQPHVHVERPASAPSAAPARPAPAAATRRPHSAGSLVDGPVAPADPVGAELPLPKCKCLEPAVMRTVKKQGANQGKQFYVCSKPQGLQCPFFEWADALPDAAIPGIPGKRALSEASSAASEGVAKRPRFAPSKSVITLGLLDMETLTFTMHMNTGAALKAAVKDFAHAKVSPTEMLGVEKVMIPMENVAAFETHVASFANTSVEYSFPRHLLARIAEYKALEERREAAGDIVTRPLNEILPPLICEKLMDFQWHGVHFALKRGGRCLIGDDMGLGKTLQAISVARIYMSDWPLLIVCPSSLRLNWKEEFLRWLDGDVSEGDIHIMMTGKDIDKPLKRVNIVSYDLMWKIPPQFLRRCKFVIADESHYLKSTSAKRSKAMTPLIKNAKRALLLSGTPALSRPVELFPQINAVAPVLFPRYTEYVERYCAAHHGRFGYMVNGASNLDELHTLLAGSLLIRRKKEDVLTQLPEKQRQVLWVQTKPKVMKQVEQGFADLDKAKVRADEADTEEQIAIAQNAVRAAQNNLYTLTGLAKLDSVEEFCKDTAETGCKFIVFLHHTEMLSKLDEYLTKKLKLGIIRIDGNTPQGSRQGLCRKFQEDAKCRVALLSITAAGVGLTLTKATVVLFAELYWNPGSLLQAEDRAHRIGQRDCVLVKYLLARNTFDESMWSTVRRKLNVVGQSLTGAAGRMDLTDGKSTTEKIEPAEGGNSLQNFFKPRPKARAAGPLAGSSNEVIDLDADDTQQSLPEALIVPDSQLHRDVVAKKDASATENLFPTSLDGLEPFHPMSALTDNGRARNKIIDSDLDIDIVACRRKQQQMDADIALARRLQAQFDAEHHG